MSLQRQICERNIIVAKELSQTYQYIIMINNSNKNKWMSLWLGPITQRKLRNRLIKISLNQKHQITVNWKDTKTEPISNYLIGLVQWASLLSHFVSAGSHSHCLACKKIETPPYKRAFCFSERKWKHLWALLLHLLLKVSWVSKSCHPLYFLFFYCLIDFFLSHYTSNFFFFFFSCVCSFVCLMVLSIKG